MKKNIFTLAVIFTFVSCAKQELEPLVSDVSFTPCQQTKVKSAELSDGVDVEFTNEGVQITHYDFEVTCDFTAVNVSHTFVNGVLNITQEGSPSQADCVCYTDVLYTINGFSQEEVNVIFINGEPVYCRDYSEVDYPIEIPFEEYSLSGTSCRWINLSYDGSGNVIIVNNNEELENYISCDDNYPVIDFSKFTLLLAYGYSPSQPAQLMETTFLKNNINNYTLEVTIFRGLAGASSVWHYVFLISKIANEASITLNVIYL